MTGHLTMVALHCCRTGIAHDHVRIIANPNQKGHQHIGNVKGITTLHRQQISRYLKVEDTLHKFVMHHPGCVC